MLAPNERITLLDQLRPPPGYYLDAALGTTYGLDFAVLTSALLAFIDAEAEEFDRAAKLVAMRRLSNRVRVYVHRGTIKLEPGPKPERLFALYDRMIHEARLEEASFHPKVWVARYLPRQTSGVCDAPARYRLLCSSRNLSSARNWELGACLEGEATDHRTELGSDVAGFASFLVSHGGATPALDTLVSELPNVEFTPPREGREQTRFVWQQPGSIPLLRHLPARGARALVVSPFVGPSFLSEVLKRFPKVVLVSTQEELDARFDLIQDLLKRVSKTYVVTSYSDNDLALQSLHAKLVACESEAGSVTFMGSANATAAGWGTTVGQNCEAVLSLHPGIRIGAFVSAFIEGKQELQRWVEEYEHHPVEVDAHEAASRAIDAKGQELCEVEFALEYDADNQRLLMRAGAGAPMPGTDQGRYQFAAAPYLLRDRADGFRPVEELFDGSAAFEGVEAADVCEFVVARVEDREFEDLRRFFVLRVPPCLPESLREAKEDEVYRRLAADIDPKALLWAILWGVGARPTAANGHAHESRGARHANRSPLLEATTIEGILESCTADPTRMDDIDSLLRTFADHPVFDPAFRSFWTTFRKAQCGFQEDDEP